MALFPNDIVMREAKVPTERRIRPIGAWLLYLASFAGGMAMGFAPTIFSGFERIQTDPGDTVLNHYFLEHSWRWVSDPIYPATFWSPRFFYPHAYALTYSENLIGTAPLYWGCRLICSDEIAWQWWVLLLSALNYWAMLIVLRWFGINPILAALGGFLFAFGLPRQAQFNHQHLMPNVFGPFLAWYFWQFLQRPDRRGWIVMLLLTAWQLLASIHLGWFLAFALGVWFLIAVAFDHAVFRRCREFVLERPGFVLVTTALWLGGLGLFFRNYYIGNADARREYGECLEFMPLWSSWFACPAHSLWELHLSPIQHYHEHERHLCMGLAFFALFLSGIAWGFRHRRDAALRSPALLALTSLLTCLLLVLLTVSLGGECSAWYLVYHGVPGANSIRAIGRVCFAVMVLGVIGALVALQQTIEARVATAARRGVCYGLIFAIVAGEQICVEHDSFPRREFYPAATNLAKTLTNADAAFVIEDHWSGVPRDPQDVLAMWAGMHANMPMINGYSGRMAPGYDRINDEPLYDLVAFLGDSWQGRLLIIDRSGPVRTWRYDVRPGSVPSARVTLVADEGAP